MEINIRGKRLTLPILQGGMGVGVSLDKLAGSVAACGGMGTISTAVCGYKEPDFEQSPNEANLHALEKQVHRAKELAKGAGMVAINAMVATSQYADSIRTALKAGVDAVVCGAGLPKDLPAITASVPESDAAIAPVVSSGRAAALICKLWDKHYNRVPDFIVLEGPLAGGHLGFTAKDAESAQKSEINPLMSLLSDTLKAIKPFIEKYKHDIPVFVAGGVKDGADMAQYMKNGAAGAQFATRFITTEECDASEAYKQMYLEANSEDAVIIQSPVGMPGRALNTPLIERVKKEGRIQPKSCIDCLTVCNPKETPYCISKALIAAAKGDKENGLFFCGSNVGTVKRISTVREQIEQIMKEWRLAQ